MVTYLNNSYVQRAGAAFATSGSVGVSLDTASNTQSANDASKVGSVLAPNGTPPQQQDKGFWGEVWGGVTNALNATAVPVTKVKDYVSAGLRASDVHHKNAKNPIEGLTGGLWTLGYLLPGLGFADPTFRHEFAVTEKNGSSLGRTAIDGIVHSDQNYAMLDDPSRQAEEDSYFNHGWQRWTSGTVDLGADIWLDPTVVGGKALGVARAARNTIKAADVAAAAGRSTAALSGGAKRVALTVDRAVEASERVRAAAADGATGGYAALARTRFLSQSADAGAVSYMMRRADTIADDATRINLKRNVFYAGMGDRTAMKALQKTHDDLALELKTLNGPNQLSAMQSVLSDGRYSYLDQLRLSQDEDYIARVVGIHQDEIQKTMDALKRTEGVATHGGGYDKALASAVGVGELGHLTDTAGREFMSIGKTITRGSVLPPVHVVNPLGRHIPGMFSLSDQSSLASFKASTGEFAQMFKGKVAKDGTSVENIVGDLLDRYATVDTVDPAVMRASRKAIVDDFHKIATQMLAKKYGGGSKAEEKRIRGLIEQIRTKRNESTAHLVERSYRAAPNGMGTSHQPEGVITWDSKQVRRLAAKPVDGTQLDDVVSIPSYKGIEDLLAGKLKTGLAGYVQRGKNQAWELTDAGLAVTNDLWKFASLFRLGYTVRTQVDSQARQIALLGPMAYLGNAIKGTSHWAYNQGKVPVAHVAAVRDKIAAQGALARLTDRWGDDAATYSNDVAAEAARLNGIIDAPLPVVEKGAATVKRSRTELARYLGTGGRGSAYQSVDDVLRETDVVSARESIAGLMETERQGMLGSMRASGQYQNVVGSNPGWEQAYADMVNRQVRNSTPLTAMLNGSTDAAVARYYTSTPEGRAVWNELSKHYLNVDELVAAQRQQIDMLFPDQAIRDRVLSGNITADDAKTVFGTVAERPSVPAERLEVAAANPLVKRFNQVRTSFFKTFAEMPENTWVRHPFYAARKEQHLQDAIANLGGDWSKLSVSQYNDVAKRAGVLARRDVTRYMFDTSQQSNMGHFLRFVSPFYGAWSDTMRKWALIAGEVPWVVPMMEKAFMAPNAMFQTVDANGNRILSNGDVVDDNGAVIRHSADPTEGSILVPIPEWSKNFLGGFFNPGRGDAVKVNKNTLNVIFQGDPFWLPGPGPLASVPVNEIAKRAFPEMWDNQNPVGAVLRFMMPYGLDEASPQYQTLPMWAKNVGTLFAGAVNGKPFSDDRFGQTYAMLLAEETQAERAGLRPQLSDAQLQKVITNRTRNWFLLRVVGSEMPFSTQPTTRLDYYRQLYQSYQRKYGGDARQKFYDDHPEYFEAAISLSQNDSGLSATEDSWNEASKYKDQIKANPEYGWMYAGAANVAAGFDPGVYTAEKVNGLRSTKDPNTALQDMMVSKGWFDYQRVNGAIQTKLQERKNSGGSASLSAKSNADLKGIRDQYIAQLKANNKQWADAFDAGSGGRQADTFLRTAALAAQDRPDLMNRSDFQALDKYLVVRNAVREKLAQMGVASIDNAKAAPLKKIWDEFVLGLVNEDIGFQQMYNRGGLDRDNLSGAM